MDLPPNTLCAKCFTSATSNFIACHVCRAKYHFICGNINEKFVEEFNKNKNIVFNCTDCLKISSNLLSHISSLANEVRELKVMLNTSVTNEISDLKQQFVKFSTNKESEQKGQQKLCSYSSVVNNTDEQSSNALDAAAVKNKTNKQTVLPATSLPTVSSNNAEYISNTDIKTSDWKRVQRRKKKKGPIVFGANSSDELDVIAQKRWIHLSSFKPTVTCEQIINYVEKNADIGKNHMVCYKLVKKDADLNLMKRISFKLGISHCFYTEILKSELWPTDIRVRPFVNFQRNAPPIELH